MKDAESQERFDAEFNTSGLSPEECRIRVEELLIELRQEASKLAGEWLLKHGYFNGDVQDNVYYHAKTNLCRVEVVVTCYGLPLRIAEDHTRAPADHWFIAKAAVEIENRLRADEQFAVTGEAVIASRQRLISKALRDLWPSPTQCDNDKDQRRADHRRKPLSDEQTPTTEPASKQESGSTSAASSCYAGSRFRNPVPGVTLGAISPEARDLLDTIMDAYREQYNPETHMSSPDDVYQFAYWLCRWSGLIQPLAHRDSAADRLAYACAKAIMRGNVRVRSAIDDALLDYLCVGGPDGPKDVPSWVETFERNQSA